jgi:hypothetical protein
MAQPNPLHKIALDLAAYVRKAGGHVVSIVPPPDSDRALRFEAAPAIAAGLANEVAEMGFKIEPTGMRQRLDPHGFTEVITETATDGTTRVIERKHAGLVDVETFSVTLSPLPKPK